MAEAAAFIVSSAIQIGISYLFPSEGPRLKDLKISASTYGAAIPWVFGQARVPGNMIWSLPIKEVKKKKGVGKGGTYNEYTYFCTFAMGLCEGPITGIRKVWADGKVIYDASNGLGSTVTAQEVVNELMQQFFGAASMNNKYKMRFYYGTDDQLQDSAIVAAVGESLTPAYRGLAYILFDNIPLADFGNRIPQITVEVLNGDASPHVIVGRLMESDNTTLLATGYDAGQLGFDIDRSFAYLAYPDGSLKQISLTSATTLQHLTSTDLALPGGNLSQVLSCGSDGSVYVVSGSSASLSRLDPYSLHPTSSVTLTEPVSSAACALSSASVEYLLTIGADGMATVSTALGLVSQGQAYLGGAASSGPYLSCGRDADASGAPTFFAMRESGGGLILTKINGQTQTDVLTFSATDGSAVPCGMVWDSSVPGVVMFWRAGSQAYVSKWSEDTGIEAWRTPIVAAPNVYSGQSRLLIQQLAFVADGELYLLDTATGALKAPDVDAGTGAPSDLAGQPNWDDYLARYPDVMTAFHSGGWLVAPTAQAYAQVEYTQTGQGEGRTLNYYGSSDVQGAPLGDGFTGASSNLQAFDSARGILLCLDGLNALVKATSITSGVSVGTVVERLLLEGGLGIAQFDLTAIYDIPLRGYGWASGTDVKGVIDELRRLYLFDLVEKEGQIVAVMREDPTNGLDSTVETILQAALGGSGADAAALDYWQETRIQEADLPAQVSLAYMNIQNDYETSVARSARITNPIPAMFSRQQVAMEMNVVMTPDEAKIQTNKILYSQWLERTKHTTHLPWAYLNLDPADMITVSMDDGRVYTDRVHHTEIGADYSIAVEAYASDVGAYDGWSDIVKVDPAGTPTSITQPGLALPVILNTPLLRDQDNQGGSISVYYTGVANGIQQQFEGAGLYRATNNLDYNLIQSSSQDVEWGAVVGVLPPAPAGPFALDWKSKLIVRPSVSWFELESITDDELWGGANACVVGNEVIQFQNAVENGDGTWTLTNLLRGRRGTEYAHATHQTGERFYFLDSATIALAADIVSARGQGRFFKGVAQGRTLSEAPTLSIVYEPRDLMPYAPADIRREFTSAGVEITWARRTRLGGNMIDGTGEVPLNETYERYEVYILAAPYAGDLSRGAAPLSYLRTYTVPTPTATYSLAEMDVDGFAPSSSPLHVLIYQLSDAVGRGFPSVRTIAASDVF